MVSEEDEDSKDFNAATTFQVNDDNTSTTNETTNAHDFPLYYVRLCAVLVLGEGAGVGSCSVCFVCGDTHVA